MSEKQNLHVGHRQRLKSKVNNYGIKTLNEHEILELLLTYSIPQKDTNELAHNLINTFSNLSSVLDASREDLKLVKGVGDETALFLTSLPYIFDCYTRSKISEKPVLNSTYKCVEFFRKNECVKKSEVLYIACVDPKNKLLRLLEFCDNDTISVNVDMRGVMQKVLPTGTRSIVLFHTHPQGNCNPSTEDVSTTKKMLFVCVLLGIDINEHLILNENDYFSFGASGLLEQIRGEVNQTFKAVLGKEQVSVARQEKEQFIYE